MPLWLQHLLVIALVVFALVVIIRQAIATLRLRHGKVGSCCAKGCGNDDATRKSTDERIVFFPVDSLKRKR